MSRQLLYCSTVMHVTRHSEFRCSTLDAILNDLRKRFQLNTSGTFTAKSFWHSTKWRESFVRNKKWFVAEIIEILRNEFQTPVIFFEPKNMKATNCEWKYCFYFVIYDLCHLFRCINVDTFNTQIAANMFNLDFVYFLSWFSINTFCTRDNNNWAKVNY